MLHIILLHFIGSVMILQNKSLFSYEISREGNDWKIADLEFQKAFIIINVILLVLLYAFAYFMPWC